MPRPKQPVSLFVTKMAQTSRFDFGMRTNPRLTAQAGGQSRGRRPALSGRGGASPFAGATKRSGMDAFRAAASFLKNRHRWILKPALQAADIGSVDPRVDRERLLRKSPADANAAKAPA